MNPILKGTAARLGLRKPLPTLEYVVAPEMAAFNAAMKGMREFMAENDRKVQQAFAALRENLRRSSL